VYEDARAALADLAERLDAVIASAVMGIGTVTQTSYAGDMDEHGHMLFNPAPHARDALVKLPAPAAGQVYTVATESGWQAIAVQPVGTGPDGNTDAVIAAVPAMPGWGFRRLVICPKKEAVPAVQYEPVRLHGNVLENACVRVVFADSGEIVSLVDKRVRGQRELVLPGQALNRLDAFHDRPADFDAWNIDTTFEQKRYPVEAVRVEAMECGPLRATMRVERRVLSSCVTQYISLSALSAQLDFATSIDWHDHNVLLKAAFPLDLRTRTATSDIQYGAIERPTHRNTSWDQAQFETVAHKWVDLSEAGYGVALLNDGRYGHDVHASTIRVSLLRSPTEPDPHADQGIHSVTYSLYPHPGDWRAGGVMATGYAMNRPVWHFPAGHVEARVGAASSDWLFRTDHDAAVIETVKRSVRGDRLIVRVYEAHGGRCRPTVSCSREIVAVEECDLLERPLRADTSPAHEAWLSSPVASHDAPETGERQWSFQLRPYEVRTFAVHLGG
jgi:alpha-mannosidase